MKDAAVMPANDSAVAVKDATFYPYRGSIAVTRNREDQVLAYIKEFYHQHQIGPTVRELVDVGFMASTGSMGPLLRRLAARGLVKKVGKLNHGGYVPTQQPDEPCLLCGCDGVHS